VALDAPTDEPAQCPLTATRPDHEAGSETLLVQRTWRPRLLVVLVSLVGLAVGLLIGPGLIASSQAATKTVYIPASWASTGEVPWSSDRSKQSANFILLWGEKSGTDPLNAPSGYQFDPDNILSQLWLRRGQGRDAALGISTTAGGQVSFQTQPGESEVHLVVVGAPGTMHHYGFLEGYTKNYRYPYEFRVSGAVPDGYQPGYSKPAATGDGHWHSNGGGWVSNSANVASTAYVGPRSTATPRSVATPGSRVWPR
jgi:hypothetical protein